MALGAFRLNGLSKLIANLVSRPAVTVTAVGGAKVSTAQSVFGGASLALAANGDRLTTSNIYTAGSTFTIEGRFRLTSIKNDNGFYQGDVGQGNRRHAVWIGGPARGSFANQIIVALGVGSPFDFLGFSTGTLSLNTWYHLAVTRDSSNNVRAFLDGSQLGAAQNSSREMFGLATTSQVGDGTYINSSLFGNIDELRVSNIARYTSNFTPPTAAFVDDQNTLLLLHMDGANNSTVFTDDNVGGQLRDPVSVTATGNSKISTAQSVFGGASALFDGSGDWLTVGTIQNQTTSDNFSIEGWVRFNSLPSVWTMFTGASSNTYVGLRNYSGTYALGAAITGTSGTLFKNMTIPTAPVINTWYHWAITKQGTELRHFWNGTLLTTVTAISGSMSNDKGWSQITRVGNWFNATDYSVNGYLDEVRFSNNARYTSGFTPPTSAFVNDANTLLLLHMDGANNSTVFTDDNV